MENTFTFGKYNGLPFSVVLKDISYMSWLKNNMLDNEELQNYIKGLKVNRATIKVSKLCHYMNLNDTWVNMLKHKYINITKHSCKLNKLPNIEESIWNVFIDYLIRHYLRKENYTKAEAVLNGDVPNVIRESYEVFKKNNNTMEILNDIFNTSLLHSYNKNNVNFYVNIINAFDPKIINIFKTELLQVFNYFNKFYDIDVNLSFKYENNDVGVIEGEDCLICKYEDIDYNKYDKYGNYISYSSDSSDSSDEYSYYKSDEYYDSINNDKYSTDICDFKIYSPQHVTAFTKSYIYAFLASLNGYNIKNLIIYNPLYGEELSIEVNEGELEFIKKMCKVNFNFI